MPEVSHCYLSAKRGRSQTQDCRSPQRFTTNSGQKAVTTREPRPAPWQGDAPGAGVTGGWFPFPASCNSTRAPHEALCRAPRLSPIQLECGESFPGWTRPWLRVCRDTAAPRRLGRPSGGVCNGGGAGVPREREAGGDVPPLVCGFWAPSCGALGISSSLPSSPEAAAERSPEGFTRRSRLASAPHRPVLVPPVRVAFVTVTSCSSSQSLVTSLVSKNVHSRAGWPLASPAAPHAGPGERGRSPASSAGCWGVLSTPSPPPPGTPGRRGPFTCCPSQLRSAVASPGATVLPRFWVSSQARPAALQGSHPSLKRPASEVMSPQQKWKHLHRHTARPRIPPKLSNFLPELSRQLFRERTGNCL